MTPHAYQHINPIAPYAESASERNIFFGLTAYVIDFHTSEMSGSDCAVAYRADSREAFIEQIASRAPDLGPEWAASLIDEGGGYEYLVEKKGLTLPEGFYWIGPGFKHDLMPLDAVSAKALIDAAYVDCDHLRHYELADENADWREIEHRSYNMEKLGRVLFNCRNFR